MQNKIKWGILGNSKLAIQKVIPAMQKSDFCDIHAIASRDLLKAVSTAQKYSIPRQYGSYEELIKDTSIEAVYIPLPNHLHVHWSEKCMAAGKHVLCEKPLALTVKEMKRLIKIRDQQRVKIGEAFMVKTHPQWMESLKLIKTGQLGKIKTIHGFLSYHNVDPGNIRNIPEYGGGALWDIGCYLVTMTRFIFQEEPLRVVSLINYDPEMKIDRLASVLMDFPAGQASFTVSTQLVSYQRMHFLGTKKRLEIEIPFNVPNDRASKIMIDDSDLYSSHLLTREFEICDQYTLQADHFSNAILSNKEVAVPLEDALKNTAVIEALFRSAKTNHWEKPIY